MDTTLHEQKLLFIAKSSLDPYAHEKTIICRQLFAGHVVGSEPMKRMEKMNQMIIKFMCDWFMEAQINQQQMLLTPVTGIKKRETIFL